MNLNELADSIHQLAKSKGWHSFGETELQFVTRFIANLHGEASELWEAARNNQLHSACDKTPKLTCEEEEVADLLIRTLDFAAARGIDIDNAVKIKQEFNATRPHRHGKVA